MNMGRKNKRKRLRLSDLSDKEVFRGALLTQLLFFNISVIGMFLLYRFGFEIPFTLTFDFILIGYGLLGAGLYIGIIWVVNRYLSHLVGEMDEMNLRLFANRSTAQIALLAIVVGVSEELLFRGFLQGYLGFWIATTIFILAHYRYFNNLLLTTTLILISFAFGLLFEFTGNNLLPVIAMHSVIDFVLGIKIRNIAAEIKSKEIQVELDVDPAAGSKVIESN